MTPSPSSLEEATHQKTSSFTDRLLPKLFWGVAGAMLVLLVAVAVWRPSFAFTLGASPEPVSAPILMPQGNATAALPDFIPQQVILSISRQANLHTSIPTRPREEVTEYTVDSGDSIFAIAKAFNLKPESVLWANFDSLNANPDSIAPGMKLMIPPVDGVLYKWKAGDVIENVVSKYKAEPIALLGWPGNKLDMTNPVIEPGQYVMIEGGKGEFQTWLNFTIPRGRAGVNKTIYGPGACDTDEGGYYGSGYFIWPTTNSHVLSGNDYWDGHLGIDIAAMQGDAILASDAGVVVYSGAIGGGYGLMVMIDHGNGFQTLYAHLSRLGVRCGASVGAGTVIGSAGSTGNSTGAHLHFEIRYFGAWVNPWSVIN